MQNRSITTDKEGEYFPATSKPLSVNFQLCANVKVSKVQLSQQLTLPCSHELRTFVIQLNDGQRSGTLETLETRD